MRFHGSRRDHRDRWLAKVPLALVEYPFELIMAVFGIISGPPLLLAIAQPVSLNALLPPLVVKLWAVSLVLSGVTISLGLWRHAYRAVSRGLQLLGSACVVYAIALFAVVGLTAIPAGPLITAIAVLCYLRAWWLRAREALYRRIRQSSG